jgi:hypothetical protein
MRLDIAITHSSTVKGNDLLVDVAAYAVFALFDNLWLKGAVAVARGENLKAPEMVGNVWTSSYLQMY